VCVEGNTLVAFFATRQGSHKKAHTLSTIDEMNLKGSRKRKIGRRISIQKEEEEEARRECVCVYVSRECSTLLDRTHGKGESIGGNWHSKCLFQ
jgi:hypothetical protein